MTRRIILGGREIEYELTRKRVKNINIRIKRDLTVNVSAAGRIPVAEIEALLQKKSEFILSALDSFKDKEEKYKFPTGYKSGEELTLFGETLTLFVVTGVKNEVKRLGGDVFIYALTDDAALKCRLLDKWLRQQCEEVIKRYCNEAYERFKEHGVAYPEIKLRKMKARWGDCRYRENALCFSTELYKMPRGFIEYVVYHEFTHFLCHDHSRKFYETLERFLPDYREKRDEGK